MRRLLLITALLATTPVEAQDFAGWQLKYFPDDRSPTGCMMSADYRDGTRLSLIVTTKYDWALGLSNKSWALQKDATTDVAAYVDRQFIASGKAISLDTHIALLPLTGAAAYRAIQGGQQLDLRTPRGNLSFILTGTGKAMSAVLDCAKSLNRGQSSPPTSTASEVQIVPLAEATVMLVNLLNLAGISGYQLQPPSSTNGAVAFAFSDGAQGLFLAARGQGTKTADDYAAHVISKGSETCKGEYLSGKQPIPSVDGTVVRKVIATCRYGDIALVTETRVVRRPDGFLAELSQTRVLSSETSSNPSAADSAWAALSDAAIRVGSDR
jgi:hypothetical protein